MRSSHPADFVDLLSTSICIVLELADLALVFEGKFGLNTYMLLTFLNGYRDV
jgi:hypothetical protein